MSTDIKRPSFKDSWATRKGARPQAISISQEDWVETGFIHAEERGPLVIRPKLRAMELAAWMESNREWVEAELRRWGGILFRGFSLRSEDDFQAAVAATGIALMDYIEGATPRTEIKSKLYTSTEYPAEETIAPHNELCYVSVWPLKIFFFCLRAAETGGETPVTDVRRVLTRLDPAVRKEFEAKGWMLVRNFGSGFGPSWQHSYRTESREELERYFRGADIQFEWQGSERVRTRQVRPAVAVHPHTGEEIWFNHVAFWHISRLKPSVRETFLAEFAPEDLPYNTYYGDGTPIPDEVVAHIDEAYQAETVAFPWQEGDLLMLDNMLIAHGRRPFSGPRRLLTSMGEPESRRGREIRRP